MRPVRGMTPQQGLLSFSLPRTEAGSFLLSATIKGRPLSFCRPPIKGSLSLFSTGKAALSGCAKKGAQGSPQYLEKL